MRKHVIIPKCSCPANLKPSTVTHGGERVGDDDDDDDADGDGDDADDDYRGDVSDVGDDGDDDDDVKFTSTA
eukprot:9104634-Pyramimonas_sp.AAC.1